MPWIAIGSLRVAIGWWRVGVAGVGGVLLPLRLQRLKSSQLKLVCMPSRRLGCPLSPASGCNRVITTIAIPSTTSSLMVPSTTSLLMAPSTTSSLAL
ncbi:MAG: hypothetical protein OIF54_13010 [Cohaesibacter sp.]|nr:hypothetical protein [Cohaesibacter sp.]